MKHKIGDKVRIKDLNWYDTYKDKEGIIYPRYAMPFTKTMSKYCDKIATITEVIDKGRYRLDIPNQNFIWQDYMFRNIPCNYAYKATEDIEHNKKIIEYLESLGGINYNGFSGHLGPNFCYYINNKEIICNDALDIAKNKGYIITEFKEQNTNMKERIIKISLETAKEWYKKGGDLRQVALQAYKEGELTTLPKTWEECYQLLNKGEYINEDSDIININSVFLAEDSCRNTLPVGLGKPMRALCQLLVCREVYRQGWKPDWKVGNVKYCITYSNNYITVVTRTYSQELLSFQSEEVRNKFLENFDNLIEEAKELI